jgi:transglutaminase-like putative cysteine protease
MERRTFLKAGAGASAGVVLSGLPGVARRTLAAAPAATWRTFEVTTRVEVANPTGVTRAWIPVPLAMDTDYQKRQGHPTWTGNHGPSDIYHDPRFDVGLLYAEWPAGAKEPVVQVTSRFTTRDRAVDLRRPPAGAAQEDKAVLERFLEPSTLIPTDGLVLETSRGITQGLRTDVEKARAIYEWIVENTFRDPKVRGCGLGDIKTMLETRYFGGKCADLNALFVGLARAANIPARDVYGVRVADSAEFKCLGKSGDISKAQHCRAECFLTGYGWVPVDPADVRKVVLEEKPGLTLKDPAVQRARAKLFGAWEMNWMAYNYGHDVKLPHASGRPVSFLMYPQAETAEGRRDSLEPTTFRYQITSREV